MEPEEMDLVELLTDVAVEPGWRVSEDVPETLLRAGQRGMVVHCDPNARAYDVEFLDPATGEPRVLARLLAQQLRVVERDTLGRA
jgi:Domain of unknown function (DUF4926)